MPESTIYMTCGRAGRELKLELGVGGEPVVTLLNEDGTPDTESAETADQEG